MYYNLLIVVTLPEENIPFLPKMQESKFALSSQNSEEAFVEVLILNLVRVE